MARSREEIHALCRSRGMETLELWASAEGTALNGIEKGYAQELLEILAKEKEQQEYNQEILAQAKKSNNITWIAAGASVFSALAACLAVWIGKA